MSGDWWVMTSEERKSALHSGNVFNVANVPQGLMQDLDELWEKRRGSISAARSYREEVEGSRSCSKEIREELSRALKMEHLVAEIYKLECELLELEYAWWAYYPEDFYGKCNKLQKQLKELEGKNM